MNRALLILMATAVLAESGFDARMKAGMKSLLAGDLVRAEIQLRKAVALNPDNADAHGALALALDLAHNRPEALAEFKAALRLDRRYGEGRRVDRAAVERGWIDRRDDRLDQQQTNLSIEVDHAPQPMQKERAKPKIDFPRGWNVDGSTARPRELGSHAVLWVDGGVNEFNAYDGEMWLEAARQAAPDRYEGYDRLDGKTFERGDARGVKVLYRRTSSRYREAFYVIDLVLVKGRQYARGVYEAPKSQFEEHRKTAERALDTLEFP